LERVAWLGLAKGMGMGTLATPVLDHAARFYFLIWLARVYSVLRAQGHFYGGGMGLASSLI